METVEVHSDEKNYQNKKDPIMNGYDSKSAHIPEYGKLYLGENGLYVPMTKRGYYSDGITIECKNENPPENDIHKILLYLIMDTSGSMNESISGTNFTKIDIVKDTLRALCKWTKENASFIDIELLSFNSECFVLEPLTNDISRIEEAIQVLFPKGYTNIGKAIERVSERIGNHKKKNSESNIIPFVFLLTDGDSTEGEKEISGMRSLVKRYQKKIPYPIYTFGVGRNHNAKMLSEISFNSLQGVYHFIENGQGIPECVGGCIGAISSTMIYNLELKIRIHDGCRIIVCHHCPDWQREEIKNENGKIIETKLILGHLSNGERKVIPLFIDVVEFNNFMDRVIDEFPNPEWKQKIFSYELQYETRESNGIQRRNGEVKLSRFFIQSIMPADSIASESQIEDDEEINVEITRVLMCQISWLHAENQVGDQFKELLNRFRYICNLNEDNSDIQLLRNKLESMIRNRYFTHREEGLLSSFASQKANGYGQVPRANYEYQNSGAIKAAKSIKREMQSATGYSNFFDDD